MFTFESVAESMFSLKADQLYILRSVSEDEVTREASDMGVDRQQYVDDLHQALVEGEERGREGGSGGGHKAEKDNYSFHLTPDHCHLSYEKTCKGILVSN